MILINLYKRFEFWILIKLWLIKFKKVWRQSIIKWGLYWWTFNIEIWDYVYIWENAQFWWLWWLLIWDWTIIWPNVIIRTTNHDYKTWDFLPYWHWFDSRKVIIWENCWIWDSVLITPWTIIWEWCIIGMWAVVSWEIEPFSIIVGNPWRIVKKRNIKQYKKLKKENKIYLKYKLEWKI